jgi:predicted HTH transcriptional regulator
VQFKQQFTTQKEIAADMIAFANGRGGTILFGVKDKTGEILGLNYDEIQSTSRELGNTANEQVRPLIYIQTEVVEIDGKMILVATIQEGKDKPYKTLSGNIWVKQSADKRRVTDNAEILSLFQQSGTYHPDEAGVPNTSYKDLDTLALDRYFENVYRKPMSDFDIPQDQLLQSMHITDTQGRLTTAGLLFFGRTPQQFLPVFVIKAVWFYGNSIAGTEYKDSRDIEGTIPEMYEQGIRWLKSCLRRTQDGQSFNSVGKLEISETVLEELLQNALVHIDLLKTTAIRLLVFDDRIEIVNPGCVVGGHTIEEVKKGNSFARNPLMAKFCAQTMPYRGLGSGIPRVLAEKSKVDFLDDKEGNQFTAIVSRPDTVTNSVSSQDSVEDTTQKTVEKNTLKNTLKSTLKGTRKRIVEMIESNPNTSLDQIAEQLGKNPRGIDKHIKVLREQGIIRRVGPDKGGHWEII